MKQLPTPTVTLFTPRHLLLTSAAALATILPLCLQAEVNPPVTPPGLMTWKYEYDASGQLTKTIDPNGNVTTQSYDLLKRPRQIIQPQPKPNQWTCPQMTDILSD